MILDYEDELTYTAGPPATSKQSIVGVAGTAIVGGAGAGKKGVKDAGRARDWGAGKHKPLYLRCTTAVAGASGGLQVDIVGADNEALTTNPVVLATKTIPAASLVANSLHSIPPPQPGSPKRYLGCKLTPLTSNSTTGEVIVGFVDEDGRPQDGANYI